MVPIESSICDFLLVITTNVPPILHRFQVMAEYVKFSLATGGRFTLTPSLGVNKLSAILRKFLLSRARLEGGSGLAVLACVLRATTKKGHQLF